MDRGEGLMNVYLMIGFFRESFLSVSGIFVRALALRKKVAVRPPAVVGESRNAVEQQKRKRNTHFVEHAQFL